MNELFFSMLRSDITQIKNDLKDIKQMINELQQVKAITKKGAKNENTNS